MNKINYDIKSIRKEFKERGVFYTDKALALRLKELVGVSDEVYDPTCGSGNLLSVWDDNVRKWGQELNAEQLEVCKHRLVNFTGAAGDTLATPHFTDRRFKAIVANPPFSVKWKPFADARFSDAPCLAPPSRADYAFILHCLYLLAPEGRAAILCFPGVLYRGQSEGKIRRWLVEQNVIERIESYPGGHFVDTPIATACVVLNKAKTRTDIVMCDTALSMERAVSLEEIRCNDFNLSVSTYIQAPKPEKVVNVADLERKARAAAVKRLKAELGFSMMVAQMEGWSIDDFLDELIQTIKSYRMK